MFDTKRNVVIYITSMNIRMKNTAHEKFVVTENFVKLSSEFAI